MPITKINDNVVGLGGFGKTTKKIHKIYWDKRFDPIWGSSIKDFLF